MRLNDVIVKQKNDLVRGHGEIEAANSCSLLPGKSWWGGGGGWEMVPKPNYNHEDGKSASGGCSRQRKITCKAKDLLPTTSEDRARSEECEAILKLIFSSFS